MIHRCLACVTGRMMVPFSDAENTWRVANLGLGKKAMNLRYFETSPLGDVKKLVVFVGLELREVCARELNLAAVCDKQETWKWMRASKESEEWEDCLTCSEETRVCLGLDSALHTSFPLLIHTPASERAKHVQPLIRRRNISRKLRWRTPGKHLAKEHPQKLGRITSASAGACGTDME